MFFTLAFGRLRSAFRAWRWVKKRVDMGSDGNHISPVLSLCSVSSRLEDSLPVGQEHSSSKLTRLNTSLSRTRRTWEGEGAVELDYSPGARALVVLVLLCRRGDMSACRCSGSVTCCITLHETWSIVVSDSPLFFRCVKKQTGDTRTYVDHHHHHMPSSRRPHRLMQWAPQEVGHFHPSKQSCNIEGCIIT